MTTYKLKDDLTKEQMGNVWLNSHYLKEWAGAELTKKDVGPEPQSKDGRACVRYHNPAVEFSFFFTDDMIEEVTEPKLKPGDEVLGANGARRVVHAVFPPLNGYDFVYISQDGNYMHPARSVDWELAPPKPVEFKPRTTYERVSPSGYSGSRRYLDVITVENGWAFGFVYNDNQTDYAGAAIPVGQNQNWKEAKR